MIIIRVALAIKLLCGFSFFIQIAFSSWQQVLLAFYALATDLFKWMSGQLHITKVILALGNGHLENILISLPLFCQRHSTALYITSFFLNFHTHAHFILTRPPTREKGKAPPTKTTLSHHGACLGHLTTKHTRTRTTTHVML